MHFQYLWNVANRGQIRLTCMQVRPLLIILIPLLENIMYGKREGSASPNAHSVFRVWRPLLKGPWHSWNPSPAQEPRRLSQVPSSALVPRLRKAQGSTRGSQFLLGQCYAEPDCLLQLHREIFYRRFWLYTRWCLKSLLTSREWRLQHCTEDSNKPLLRLTAWVLSKFIGVLHAGYS